MAALSEKIYLQLNMPTEDQSLADRERIVLALQMCGYEPVSVPLPVLRKLYPLCRDCGYDITVSLVRREHNWVVTDVEPGDATQRHYGLAVDYGSTTILMQLVDLNSGEIAAQAKTFNAQAQYGRDILTRITYAMEKSEHAADLRRVTAESFNALLAELTAQSGIDAHRCPVMVVSGNTTMLHFLLQLDAWTVFAAPYAPATTDPGWLRGGELGFDFEGLVYFIPAASNYIGGDIVSGLLTLDIHKQDEICLFFDIGTNGELVLGNRHWLMAGAGAAGPALEGDVSRFGMRAADGAIDYIAIEDGGCSFSTIGGGKPKGICGSGIIDLVAQMRLSGWINIAGTLQPEAAERVVWLEDEGQYAAVYATAEESATGEALFFTQTDIGQYIEAKAAAYTMIECLLEAADCRPEELARVYLSGAFTAHSDLESAITIGVFPDLPRERYTAIGNTSLDGARLVLLDREKPAEARMLAESIYCVQFASMPDFLTRMFGAKFIPHTSMERYPSVAEKLEGHA